MKTHLRKMYPKVEDLTDELIEIAVNDYDCESVVWDWLHETGEGHYTRDTFRRIARDILTE